MVQDTEKSKKSVDPLLKWTAGIKKHKATSWDRLPDLDLYMDQVTTFMNRQLDIFSPDGEKMLTPSMINNYVKDGVVPRPDNKKYNKDHIAMLMIICLLKPMLSLPEIDILLRGLATNTNIEDLYISFLELLNASVEKMAKRIPTDILQNEDVDAKYKLVLQLATEANLLRVAASRILNSIEKKPKDVKTEK